MLVTVTERNPRESDIRPGPGGDPEATSCGSSLLESAIIAGVGGLIGVVSG